MGGLQAHLERFSAYAEEHELFPKGKDIIVLASGGKDSNAMVVLLEEYRKTRPSLKVSYLNVLFPQDLYGEDLIGRQGLIAERLEHFTSVVPSVARDALLKEEEPCQRCKDIRTAEIAAFLKDKDPQKLVILTGHTNDDLLAYFIELFSISFKEVITDINFERLKDLTLTQEQYEHYSRFLPKIEFASGVTLGKPLLSFTRRDVLDILSIAGIQRHATRCIFACKRPKRNLFEILDFLNKEEAEELYRKYSTERLAQELSRHAANGKEALEHIEKQDYRTFLL